VKIKLKITFAALFILVAVVVVCSVQTWYYQVQLGPSLNADFGFTHGSPYVRCGTTKREVFAIHSVQPDGVFALAGFTRGDIVVGMSITQFYRTLHRGRGGEVTVSVVDGGDGPALSERRVRQLRFQVPKR
jgi:hypothetical protein